MPNKTFSAAVLRSVLRLVASPAVMSIGSLPGLIRLQRERLVLVDDNIIQMEFGYIKQTCDQAELGNFRRCTASLHKSPSARSEAHRSLWRLVQVEPFKYSASAYTNYAVACMLVNYPYEAMENITIAAELFAYWNLPLEYDVFNDLRTAIGDNKSEIQFRLKNA